MPLYKKNQSPTKLRGRHFNYELIEDQSVKKQPNIDVLLTSYVAGVGRKGEIVNVAPTYAYNKLLIPGFATYVTPENVEKFSKISTEDVEDDEEKHSSQFAQRVSSRKFMVTLKLLMILIAHRPSTCSSAIILR